MNKIADRPYFSTTDAAKILGISRVAVFQMIQSGRLKAERFGRNYLVARDSLAYNAGFLTDTRQNELDSALKRIVGQYGKALKMLGKE